MRERRLDSPCPKPIVGQYLSIAGLTLRSSGPYYEALDAVSRPARSCSSRCAVRVR
jgi:hypothetical protein